MAALAFAALEPKISDALLETLAEHEFVTATPVQQATIPRLLKFQDVVVQAATGSGKTLAFLIPLFEVLGRREDALRQHQVGALIIEPTRELAMQVYTVAQQLKAAQPEMRLALMVGGTDIHAGMASFRDDGGHVLIGTPGRLNDLMERLPEMQLRELELLILDEADRLLDMGFEATINSILRRLPKQRRTGLFSATQTAEVVQLVRAGLRNPVKVEVKVQALPAAPPKPCKSAAISAKSAASSATTTATSSAASGGAESDGSGAKKSRTQATPSSLSNLYMLVEEEQRLAQLVHFVSEKLGAGQKLMVYFLTCACVDYYAAALSQLPELEGLALRPLHGKMAPKTRTKTYDWFVNTKGSGAALLCTDVAARGLDIPDVDWIVQLDAPQDPNAFVHRVGRTARMGRTGRALLFLRPAEDAYVHFLSLRKVPLQKAEPVGGLVPLRAALTKLLVADRALMEAAAKAYVAYVRAYKEHQCGYIFKPECIDLGALARSLAVLRLPRLRELGHKRMKKGGAGGWVEWSPLVEVDLDTIRYKDKQREKQRQQNKRQRLEAEAAAEAEGEEDDERVGPSGGGGSHGGKASGEANVKAEKAAREAERAAREMNEEAEMAREAALMKKLKRGKITQSQFDKLMGEAEEEEDGEWDDEGDEEDSRELSTRTVDQSSARKARSEGGGGEAKGRKRKHGQLHHKGRNGNYSGDGHGGGRGRGMDARAVGQKGPAGHKKRRRH